MTRARAILILQLTYNNIKRGIVLKWEVSK